MRKLLPFATCWMCKSERTGAVGGCGGWGGGHLFLGGKKNHRNKSPFRAMERFLAKAFVGSLKLRHLRRFTGLTRFYKPLIGQSHYPNRFRPQGQVPQMEIGGFSGAKR